MQKPIIDESKLSETMRIIEIAAELMAEKDCDEDIEAKTALEKLQQDLEIITDNPTINIRDYQRYWSAVDLKTAAEGALMPIPEKEDLSDAQIKEIVVNFLEYNETEMTWWLKYLKVNTGLDNISDYIFYPDMIGMDSEASLEQIADKIIANKTVTHS